MAWKIETHLVWIVPPACQGQGVEVSYASGEYGVYRRIHDRSVSGYPDHPGASQYEFSRWESVRGAYEPWNDEPKANEWEEAKP